MKPTIRKPLGIIAILLIILIWAIIVASFSAIISQWHALAQALFYIVAGIIWIFPVRPMLTWMETGRWR
jgi:ABC-type transport system involved in cytochrome bd biosynthesis fused ATPase/permease subunit